jgi:hypothetical protein
MRFYTGLRLSEWTVLLLLSFVLLAASPCMAHQKTTSFRRTALRLAKEFSGARDLRSLHCISQDGLELTERYVPDEDIYEMKIANTLDPHATLAPHRTIEDSTETDTSDFNQTPYRQVIDRARDLVSASLTTMPISWMTVSTMAYDHWRRRLLGPAVTGKVVAGTYWYLFLRKENGKWKIWQFELDE